MNKKDMKTGAVQESLCAGRGTTAESRIESMSRSNTSCTNLWICTNFPDRGLDQKESLCAGGSSTAEKWNRLHVLIKYFLHESQDFYKFLRSWLRPDIWSHWKRCMKTEAKKSV